MVEIEGNMENHKNDVNSVRQKNGASQALGGAPVENQVVSEIRVDNNNILGHTDHPD